MPWYRVSLTDQEIIEDKLRRLIDDFTVIWLASGTPSDAALFESNQIGHRVDYCFFSPGAVHIALPLIQSHGGIECDAPVKSSVELLVGKSDGADIPFAR